MRPTEPRQQGNSFGFTAWHGASRTMTAPHAHNDIEINFCDRPLVYSSAGMDGALPALTPCAFWGAKPHRLVDFEEGHELAFVTVPLARFMSWSLPATVKSRLLHGQVLIGDSTGLAGSVEEAVGRWSADLASAEPRRRRATELEIEALMHRMADGEWTHLSTTTGTITGTGAGAGAAARRSSLDVVRAGQMATYIADHFAGMISVGDVADSVHVSQGKAASLFKGVFGTTIPRYIGQYRVAEAQRLLLTTTLGSAEIGREVGFGSASSFHGVFRAICGTSPAQWRRAHDPGQ